VRDIVCTRCNKFLAIIDRGVRPVTAENLAALIVVRNRCPDCEPLCASGLTSRTGAQLDAGEAQRYPLGPRLATRVWELLPEELRDRLASAGSSYRNADSSATRDALAAVIHEAFLFGCAPMYISSACGVGREKVRKLAAEHGKRNPGLPPLPRRHGTGSRQYVTDIRDGKAGDSPPKRRTTDRRTSGT